MFRLFGQAEAPTAGDSVRKGFMRHGGGAPALRPGSRPEPPTRLLKGGGTAADRLAPDVAGCEHSQRPARQTLPSPNGPRP